MGFGQVGPIDGYINHQKESSPLVLASKVALTRSIKLVVEDLTSFGVPKVLWSIHQVIMLSLVSMDYFLLLN